MTAQPKKYLEAGKLTKPQGLKGEMRMQLYCDGADVVDSLEFLYMGEEKKPLEVEYCRPLKGSMAAVKLVEIGSATEAEQFANAMLYLDRDDLELDDGVWFISDLIGLKVYDADSGELYGEIDDVLQYSGSSDVYSMKTPEGKQLLFPSIPDVVIDTDIEAGKMIIRPLEGLFE